MMSQRALRLPIWAIATTRQRHPQWICRRCLASQAEATAPDDHPPLSDTQPPPPPPRIKNPEEVANYDPTLPASQRDYRLNKTDFYLKKPLPQIIPPQYLQHSTSKILHQNEREQRTKTEPHREIRGVVVSAGKMDKTVKVRVPGQRWNKKIGKYFASHTQHLVHDPNSSLVPGDVVNLHRLRVSTAVHHVVASLIAPFGKPISERPPIPSADDRLAAYKAKRFAKLHRRSLRREVAKGNADAIKELRDMGLDPGKGVEVGKSETANLQKGVGKKRTPGKGAILGQKGQKLPEGVLPGGRHEVGKIDERARGNMKGVMRKEQRVEENLREAKEMREQLRGMSLGSEEGVGEKSV